MSKKTEIRLDRDEALVLFEMLSRYDQEEELTTEDSSEKGALWSLHSALERVLAEPLAPDYADLLSNARARVRQKYDLD